MLSMCTLGKSEGPKEWNFYMSELPQQTPSASEYLRNSL